MDKLFRFLGKLLIIITLFLIAYDKFKHGNLFVKDYTHIVSQLQTIASKAGYSLPPNINQYIMYSGLFDAFVGVLLLVGDGLGVPILLLRVLVPAIVYYVPWNSKLIQSVSQKITFGNTLAVVGVAAVLFSNRK